MRKNLRKKCYVLVNLMDSKEMEMEKDLAAVKELKIKGS
ncbi:MAG: hypothetical protein H6Q54_1009, partial [Deltaproteobacteria bacterium]|nr:hypothetical protein [Deltaproteobacteria bacterium]